jgi:hypothetical protein
MGLFRRDTGTTEHAYVEERLSPYLDGELTPQEQSTVERHLAICPDCQWNLETLRQTVQWTRQLPTVPVPRVFTIPAPVRPERAPRRLWGLPALQGATALVALLLFFVVAGDILLTGFLPAAVPQPGAMQEQAVMSVQVTEAALEMEAPQAADEVAVEEAAVEPMVVEEAVEEVIVEVEKAAPTPTPLPLPAEALPTEEAVKEGERALMATETSATATPESGAMGAMGFPTPTEEALAAVVEAEAVEAPATVPAGIGGEEMQAATTTVELEPAPALLPTEEPVAAATPAPKAFAPTTIAAAPEPAPAAPEERQPVGALREPWATWIGLAEIGLAIAFVLLLTATGVLMIRRRRTG